MWILHLPFSLRSLFQPSLPSLYTFTYSSPFPLATWTSVKTMLTISTFSSPCFTTWPGFQPHKFMETALPTVTYLPTQKTMLTFLLPFKSPLPLVSETPFCPGYSSFDYSSFAHPLNVHSSLALFPFHSILQLLKISMGLKVHKWVWRGWGHKSPKIAGKISGVVYIMGWKNKTKNL